MSMDTRGLPPQRERSLCSNSSFYLKTSLMTSLLMKSPLLSMAMLEYNHNNVFTSKISIPSVACHFQPTCLSSLNLQLFRFLSLKIETFKQDSHILKPYILKLIVLPCLTAIRPWCHSCPNITDTYQRPKGFYHCISFSVRIIPAHYLQKPHSFPTSDFCYSYYYNKATLQLSRLTKQAFYYLLYLLEQEIR